MGEDMEGVRGGGAEEEGKGERQGGVLRWKAGREGEREGGGRGGRKGEKASCRC